MTEAEHTKKLGAELAKAVVLEEHGTPPCSMSAICGALLLVVFLFLQHPRFAGFRKQLPQLPFDHNTLSICSLWCAVVLGWMAMVQYRKRGRVLGVIVFLLAGYWLIQWYF